MKLRKLSDPNSYWSSRRDILKGIEEKPLHTLDVDDFSVIYHHISPAASYEEGLSYLKYLWRYLNSSEDSVFSVWPNGLLKWLNDNHSMLLEDELWDNTLDDLQGCIYKFLSHFKLYDLSEEYCENNEIDYSFSQGPYNGFTIHDIFDGLTSYTLFEESLNILVDKLIDSNEADSARWYIEIAFFTRGWWESFDSYDSEELMLKESLFYKMHSFEKYYKKGKIAGDMNENEEMYKYNELVLMT